MVPEARTGDRSERISAESHVISLLLYIPHCLPRHHAHEIFMQACPALVERWASVADAGPSFNQRLRLDGCHLRHANQMTEHTRSSSRQLRALEPPRVRESAGPQQGQSAYRG